VGQSKEIRTDRREKLLESIWSLFGVDATAQRLLATRSPGLITCRKKARWWFYKDKFSDGPTGICTTCLLAFLESHGSYARLMAKPWILRDRCGWSYWPDYAVSVREKLVKRHEIIMDGQGIRVGFGSGDMLYSVVSASLTGRSEMGDFDIQVPLGLTKGQSQSVRKKAFWLVNQLYEPVSRLNPPMTIDSIRCGDDIYAVCLTGESGLHILKFLRELIDDMTDPVKPPPETKARFNASVASEIVQAEKNLNLARRFLR
jgi:hypothetical protein